MRKILLLLAEGFEFYEASAFIDVFGWNMSMGSKDIKLVTCGNNLQVKSAFNQRIQVDMTIRDYPMEGINQNFEALVIPGGFKGYGYFKSAYNKEFLDLIKNFSNEGKVIVSVCVGTLPIAKSGILSGQRVTTYNQENGRYVEELKKYSCEYLDERIVTDKNLITCQGPESALDTAFELLKLLTDEKNMNVIKGYMGFTSV